MNTATATRRGRGARRIAAAVVAAAALSLGVTACGPDSGAAGAAGSSDSPAASGSPQTPDSNRSTGGSSSGDSGTQGQDAGKPATAPSATQGSGTGGSTGSHPAPPGGGVAHAGNNLTLVGKLEYLAPGKLIVKPEGGGTDQAFLVANATTVLGAAAICGDPDGNVTIGKDGYGTTKCNVDQLEKAAKTSSVTVRVTMDRKNGAADTVEEKYHP
ncbi:hypothetical protein [Streptomyces pinistramenti]|uniref:hypothetical protein n=1 Tax=Streptomyces pinistramenti TaxID=2884812 RepID=UPI001D065FDB|nr:hypothetical protein [Streptomyces pinistramenti]MCB5911271.1 hypothetical protein [Streptomyces pinistramenti]